MTDSIRPVEKQLIVEKVISVPHGLPGKRLFSVHDRYTMLAFIAFPMILGVETYYQNAGSSDHTVYIGGFFSLAYLLCVLVARYQRKKVWNRWREISTAGLTQRIKFSVDGVEINETVGIRQFTPWIFVKKCQISASTIQVVLAAASIIIVNKSAFTAEEIELITALSRGKKQGDEPATKAQSL